MKLYKILFEQYMPATPENIEAAKAFITSKWVERAKEYGREEPVDLSGACKFASMFAKLVFGGELRGNKLHQFVVLDNDLIDLTTGSSDVLGMKDPYKHDRTFWSNPEHKRSMASCEPRVKQWAEEFKKQKDAAQNPNSGTFQMYHGGKKMTSIPTELKSVKQGRYESGIGINLTNNFETAKRYAGGGRVVHLFDIDKDIVHTNDPRAELNLEEVIQFLKGVERLPKRDLIIYDLQRYSKRRENIKQIPADVLNNLIINHEAGAGQAGLKIVEFFLSKGIDGVFTTQNGGEVWFVLFNPSKIKNIAVVKGYPERDRLMLPNPYV